MVSRKKSSAPQPRPRWSTKLRATLQRSQRPASFWRGVFSRCAPKTITSLRHLSCNRYIPRLTIETDMRRVSILQVAKVTRGWTALTSPKLPNALSSDLPKQQMETAYAELQCGYRMGIPPFSMRLDDRVHRLLPLPKPGSKEIPATTRRRPLRLDRMAWRRKKLLH